MQKDDLVDFPSVVAELEKILMSDVKNPNLFEQE